MKAVILCIITGLLQNSLLCFQGQDNSPFYVSLHARKGKSYMHRCGAGLISRRAILTLATCFTNVAHDKLARAEYRTEEANLVPAEDFAAIMNINSDPILRRLDKYILHSNWQRNPEHYNLALGRFNESIPADADIKPVNIPSQEGSLAHCSYVTLTSKTQTKTGLLNFVKEAFEVISSVKINISVSIKAGRAGDASADCVFLESETANDTLGGSIICDDDTLTAVTSSINTCNEIRKNITQLGSFNRQLVPVWRHHDWIEAEKNNLGKGSIIRPGVTANILIFLVLLEKLLIIL